MISEIIFLTLIFNIDSITDRDNITAGHISLVTIVRNLRFFIPAVHFGRRVLPVHCSDLPTFLFLHWYF